MKINNFLLQADYQTDTTQFTEDERAQLLLMRQSKLSPLAFKMLSSNLTLANTWTTIHCEFH